MATLKLGSLSSTFRGCKRDVDFRGQFAGAGPSAVSFHVKGKLVALVRSPGVLCRHSDSCVTVSFERCKCSRPSTLCYFSKGVPLTKDLHSARGRVLAAATRQSGETAEGKKRFGDEQLRPTGGDTRGRQVGGVPSQLLDSSLGSGDFSGSDPNTAEIENTPCPEDDGQKDDASTKRMASAVDMIEIRAKASIDKLRHLLYKLKSKSDEKEESSSSGRPLEVSQQLPPVSNGVSVEENQELYVSQKFQVPLEEAEIVDEEVEIREAAPTEWFSDDATMIETMEEDLLTCTRTSVQVDETTQTAVVTIMATVRVANLGKDGKQRSDVGWDSQAAVAMAAKALARSAATIDQHHTKNASVSPLATPVPHSRKSFSASSDDLSSSSRAMLQASDRVIAALSPTPQRQELHAGILQKLEEGKVLGWQAMEGAEGYGVTAFRRQSMFIVELGLGPGHKEFSYSFQSQAVFKPFLPGDAYCRWRRAPADWVAYRLNLLLGLDMVPPAVIRQDMRIGAKKWAMGVLIQRVHNVAPLMTLLTKADQHLQLSDEELEEAVSHAHVLDALMGNAIRTQEGFLAASHWLPEAEAGGEAEGSVQGEGQRGSRQLLCPVLLDHPMGPGLGEDLPAMWARRGGGGGGGESGSSNPMVQSSVKRVSSNLLVRLRGLSRSMLLEAMAGALTGAEMELILEKRDQVLAYLDSIGARKRVQTAMKQKRQSQSNWLSRRWMQ
eukprot:TRINITY_DN4238_c0_g1_i1.p1 TRINITY_DN4238_c0_g1~~TRINITY_DN4238_c0_g1_i1.p1  ORF type:complete len:723 (-),score=172.39 TRINITY_DN4238_c0_g1_i1:220-2388(-)